MPAVCKPRTVLCFAFLFSYLTAQSQLKPKERDSLRSNITRIAQGLNARVGVSILQLETSDTLTYRGGERFPMLSVYKFPIAIGILRELDKGSLFMEKYLILQKDSIHTGEEERYADVNFPDGRITIGQLLTLMLVQGSNTACDLLLSQLGGPATLQQYLDDLDIHEMAIANTERELHADPLTKNDNWSTPNEMVRLLQAAYRGDYLSGTSHNFLWEKMAETVTGPDRIKGLLPKGTLVAHRTGTDNDVSNDVGIITLPGGKHLVVAVFIAEAKEYPETCSAAIAKIAKLAWDYYSAR